MRDARERKAVCWNARERILAARARMKCQQICSERMSEKTISIDGIRSPLLEFGPASSDEAVVFVHGNPGSIRDWDALARSVGEFGRAVAIDMPGFGAADKPADFDYSVGGYARHLSKLMADRWVRQAHLVMHDFGGPWGLAWASNNPQAVASVTCINTGVLSRYRWHYLARIWHWGPSAIVIAIV
jgi:pimeloyl-ACP methyl ester carboxylesterase